jgi:transcriptional regulator with XRE-family HTH domain
MNTRVIADWIKSHEPKGKFKLCGRAEISPGTLDNILAGHEPNLKIVRKISTATGISIDELCQDTERQVA